jgi:hypothetical protein
MDQVQLNKELVWSMVQQPRCAGHQSASYMLLLAALDKGWQVSKVELAPSWDQTGFVYLVTLRHANSQLAQEMILPRNTFVDDLLHELGATFQNASPRFQPFLWYG